MRTFEGVVYLVGLFVMGCIMLYGWLYFCPEHKRRQRRNDLIAVVVVSLFAGSLLGISLVFR